MRYPRKSGGDFRYRDRWKTVKRSVKAKPDAYPRNSADRGAQASAGRRRAGRPALSANAPGSRIGGEKPGGIASTPVVASRDPHRDAVVDRFWAVELGAADQQLLDAAFERDRELRRDTAHMFGGLVELDLREVFVGALVDRLRVLENSRRPVAAVLSALEQTLAVARARGQARAVARWQPR